MLGLDNDATIWKIEKIIPACLEYVREVFRERTNQTTPERESLADFLLELGGRGDLLKGPRCIEPPPRLQELAQRFTPDEQKQQARSFALSELEEFVVQDIEQLLRDWVEKARNGSKADRQAALLGIKYVISRHEAYSKDKGSFFPIPITWAPSVLGDFTVDEIIDGLSFVNVVAGLHSVVDSMRDANATLGKWSSKELPDEAVRAWEDQRAGILGMLQVIEETPEMLDGAKLEEGRLRRGDAIRRYMKSEPSYDDLSADEMVSRENNIGANGWYVVWANDRDTAFHKLLELYRLKSFTQAFQKRCSARVAEIEELVSSNLRYALMRSRISLAWKIAGGALQQLRPGDFAAEVHKAYGVPPDTDAGLSPIHSALWFPARERVRAALERWTSEVYPAQRQRLRDALSAATTIGAAELVKTELVGLEQQQTETQRILAIYHQGFRAPNLALNLMGPAIYKVADIVEVADESALAPQGGVVGKVELVEESQLAGEAAGILVGLEPVEGEYHPDVLAWEVDIAIGEGASERTVPLNLPPVVGATASLDRPVFLAGDRLLYFCDQLFLTERLPEDEKEREEIVQAVSRGAAGQS